jgi:Fic family protein
LTDYAETSLYEANLALFASKGDANLLRRYANDDTFTSCLEANMYIWELPEWPRFRWDSDALVQPLAAAHLKQGRLLGRMEHLGFDLQLSAEIEAVTEEALGSSEIEGEILNRESVRSSVARRLGVPEGGVGPEDRRVEGIVEMTLDATKNFATPVTRERLFGWQAALFPTGRSGLNTIKVGEWRDDAHGPMQVISGRFGREKIHFEAPPAVRVEVEIEAFLDWYNKPHTLDGIIHASIAHLWFVTIHPFDDGNGRVARALADMSLARSENSPQRFYSLSDQIRRDRSGYYGSLESTQKGDLEITARLRWFIECFSKTLDRAEQACASVLRKVEFWRRNAMTALNERQRNVLNQYLDGFEGKLTARKWSAIAKCSIPTAQRDIKELVDRGLLIRNEGGSKNTSYNIVEA